MRAGVAAARSEAIDGRRFEVVDTGTVGAGPFANALGAGSTVDAR
jgi:hypothetical protein